MDVHETHELAGHVEHAHHGGHGHDAGGGSKFNKRVALQIAVLAALLAISELGSKGSQNEYLAKNIEANDLWAFYQAKSIRETIMRTAADQLELAEPNLPQATAGAATKKIAEMRATAQRYASDPSTGEGRKELQEHANQAEHERDLSLAKYHNFEFGSAAFQLAIVLASAAVVTSMPAMAVASGVIGAVGILFSVFGWFFPLLIHLE